MKTLKNIVVLVILATMIACSSENDPYDDNNGNKAKPVLTIKLTDSPSAYDAVNVEILSMRANFEDGWVDLPLENPGVHNLLQFVNGNTLILIGDTALAPGVITELRLILGSNNSVIVDGESYDLQTPSGQSSGYKIKMDPQLLEPGGVYTIVIDFDVSESIHQTGNGKYMLKPVCRGYLETAIGAIAGVVVPPNHGFCRRNHIHRYYFPAISKMKSRYPTK
jgi:hypothetical protein